MKALALALITVLSLAQAAHAAPTTHLNCDFTEPFFDLDIDQVKRQVTRTEPNWSGEGTVTKVIARNIQVQSDLSDPFLPKYKILNKKGQVIAELALDVKGSDGMSDRTFPFSIKHAGMEAGCSTDKIDFIDPHGGV